MFHGPHHARSLFLVQSLQEAGFECFSEGLHLDEYRSLVDNGMLASVYQLHDLVEETFRLVETYLGEVDTTPARERFRVQHRAWEHPPDELL